MSEIQNWRKQLATIVFNSYERQRVANALDVSISTLMRWINGESTPRPQKMRALLQVLPEHKISLYESFIQEFPYLQEDLSDTAQLKAIPVSVYEKIIKLVSSALPFQVKWSSIDVVLRQISQDFDPDNQGGISVILSQCMPPRKGKILSLRQFTDNSSSDLLNDFTRSRFWGVESLAGRSVITGQRAILELLRDQPLFDAKLQNWIQSGISYPIQRGNLVAGSLLIFSNRTNLSSFIYDLGQSYADLLSLVFSEADFYPYERIMLGMMPSIDIQRKYLATFPKRVGEVLITAMEKGELINKLQIEEIVWQDIEKELLDLTYIDK